MNISVVVPVYNEEENIIRLIQKIKPILSTTPGNHEILFIDDGSKDKTYEVLQKCSQEDKSVKVIKFLKNFGQTAALNAGFRHAKGEVIVTMDGDLQNDPSDIPKLLEKLERGYDVVSGWRYNRRDPSLKKVLPSLIASFIRRRIIGDKVHDSGCSLKAYRQEVVKDLKLLGESHRFIPLILQLQGCKIGEVKVNHYPRKFGKTKYGVKRLWNGLFDILGLIFWHKYGTKPLYIFGAISLFSMCTAVFVVLYVFLIAFLQGVRVSVGPLLLFSVLLFLAGIQTFLIGIIAEMQTRLYYNDKESYTIEKMLNE
ncbi:MAG: glycosyltransferase family 2 protein [bacterium]|nr:glycosyltransferase family 2 protein [bacterium]